MAAKTDSDRVREAKAFLKAPFHSYEVLTERQARVALLTALGWTTEQIAFRLGVQRNTVASHLRDVKRKTGLGKFDLTEFLLIGLREILK